MPANPNSESKHLLQAQSAHLEWIGGRVITLLSQYWRDDDPVELTAAIGADWAKVLRNLSKEAIEKACLQYLRDEPRRKPTPGEIFTRASKAERKPLAQSGGFQIDPDIERQCVIRVETEEPYDTWPRDQLEYMVKARGEGQVVEWMNERKGWYRPGGPADQLKAVRG